MSLISTSSSSSIEVIWPQSDLFDFQNSLLRRTNCPTSTSFSLSTLAKISSTKLSVSVINMSSTSFVVVSKRKYPSFKMAFDTRNKTAIRIGSYLINNIFKFWLVSGICLIYEIYLFFHSELKYHTYFS